MSYRETQHAVSIGTNLSARSVRMRVLFYVFVVLGVGMFVRGSVGVPVLVCVLGFLRVFVILGVGVFVRGSVGVPVLVCVLGFLRVFVVLGVGMFVRGSVGVPVLVCVLGFLRVFVILGVGVFMRGPVGVPVGVHMFTFRSVRVFALIRVDGNQLIRQRLATPQQLNLQPISGVQVVRITDRHEFDGVTQHGLPIIRFFVADLENRLYVFGIAFYGVLIQYTLRFTLGQHIYYTVVLQVSVEIGGRQFDAPRPRGYPGHPGARRAGLELQDRFIFPFAPLRRVNGYSLAVTQQTDIRHPVTVNRIFACRKRTVIQFDRRIRVRLKKEAVQF